MSTLCCIEGDVDEALAWPVIDWSRAERHVGRLQARIVKATQAGRWHRVRCLQRLLQRSFSAKLLVVRRVSSNRGKRTPGVDGVTLETSTACWQLAQQLGAQDYKPQPLRRIYIPKKNGKQRPLGIPTMRDRAEQALARQALDPVAECMADTSSHGFRLRRSAQDAMAACFQLLARRNSPRWVLEGDIEGCFDNIDHQWLLEHIPTNTELLRQWLKAGYMERGMFNPTTAGTPQGGIISPTLANLALDGLEGLLQRDFRGRKVHLVRYADDFIITGDCPALLAHEVQPRVAGFLRERGLTLSAHKTHITSIDAGFDFLGFNTRKYQGKLLIKPASSSIAHVKERIRETVRAHRGSTQGTLIGHLNPLLRGWANYYRHVVSKEVFSAIDTATWSALWQWAKRRHPNRPRTWIKNRYFPRQGDRSWVFTDGKVELFRMATLPIRYHVKVRGDANPYDPAWGTYFRQRLARYGPTPQDRFSSWPLGPLVPFTSGPPGASRRLIEA